MHFIYFHDYYEQHNNQEQNYIKQWIIIKRIMINKI